MNDSDRIIHFAAPAGLTPEQIRQAGADAAMREMENDVTDMLTSAFGKPHSRGNFTFDL